MAPGHESSEGHALFESPERWVGEKVLFRQVKERTNWSLLVLRSVDRWYEVVCGKGSRIVTAEQLSELCRGHNTDYFECVSTANRLFSKGSRLWTVYPADSMTEDPWHPDQPWRRPDRQRTGQLSAFARSYPGRLGGIIPFRQVSWPRWYRIANRFDLVGDRYEVAWGDGVRTVTWDEVADLCGGANNDLYYCDVIACSLFFMEKRCWVLYPMGGVGDTPPPRERADGGDAA